MPRLLNVFGMIGVAMLVCGWLVLAQWLVFHPQPLGGFEALGPGARAVLLAAICGVWLVLTAGNDQMANASSLHSFYRARLTRAYLAVGNDARPIAYRRAPPAPSCASARRDGGGRGRRHRPAPATGPRRRAARST